MPINSEYSYKPVQLVPVTDPEEQARVEQYIFGLKPTVPEALDMPASDDWEITKGLKAGVSQIQALGQAAVGATADFLGFDEFAMKRYQAYNDIMKDAEQFSPAVPDVESIDSIGEFAQWAAYNLGEQLPVIASTIASAGVGGVLGAAVGRKVLTDVAAKALEKKVAKWGLAGQITGGYAASAGMEAGGVMGEQLDAGLTPQPGVALATGAASGALEFITPFTIAKKLGLGPKFTGPLAARMEQALYKANLPTRIAVTGLGIGATEAATETAQELLAISARSYVDDNYDKLGPEAASRILNAAAAGFVVGGGIGGLAGVHRGSNPNTLPPPDEAPAKDKAALLALPAPKHYTEDMPALDAVEKGLAEKRKRATLDIILPGQKPASNNEEVRKVPYSQGLLLFQDKKLRAIKDVKIATPGVAEVKLSPEETARREKLPIEARRLLEKADKEKSVIELPGKTAPTGELITPEDKQRQSYVDKIIKAKNALLADPNSYRAKDGELKETVKSKIAGIDQKLEGFKDGAQGDTISTLKSNIADLKRSAIEAPVAAGISKEDVALALQEVQKEFPGAPQVVILSKDDVSKFFIDPQYHDAIQTSAGFVDVTNPSVVYLVSDNITSPEEAVRTYVHEAIGHVGLKKLFNAKEKRALLDLVERSYPKEVEALRKRKGLPETDTMEYDHPARFEAAEELIAHGTESIKNPSFWDKVYALIRRAIRRLNPKLKFNDSELKDLIGSLREVSSAKESAKLYADRFETPEYKFRRIVSSVFAAGDPGAATVDATVKWYQVWGVKFAKLFLTPLHVGKLYNYAPVTQYIQGVEKYWSTKSAIMEPAQQIVELWSQQKNRSIAVSKVLYDMDVESAKKGRKVTDKERMEIYRKHHLDVGGQGIVEKAEKYLKDILARAREGTLYNKVRLYINDEQQAKAFLQRWKEDKDKARDYLVELGVNAKLAAGLTTIEKEFDSIGGRNYFPHKRFGEYTILARAKEAMVYEGKRYKAGALVHFEAYESKAARDNAYRDWDKMKGKFNVKASRMTDAEFAFLGLPPSLMDTMEVDLGLSAEQKENLKDIFWNLTPGQSYLKHLKKRTGIAGWSEDSMRVFASYAMQAGNHVARIEHYQDLSSALKSIEALHKAPTSGDVTVQTHIYEYWKNHFQYLIKPENDWAKYRAIGFMWYLGFSPKSAMVNLTQVPLVAFPYLSSIHGEVKSAAAIAKAMKDAARMIKDDKVLNDEEQAAMLQGKQEGWLDESWAMELAGIGESHVLQRVMPAQATTRLLHQFSYVGGYMFRHAEKFNRRATFLAGYRLAKDAGKSKEDAYLAGKEAVRTSMFEYAKWNRPEFMRGKKSVMFLFWQYLVNSAFLFGGGEGKKVAMRMMLMTLAVAGLEGLPFAEDLIDIFDVFGTEIKEMTGMKDPRVDIRGDIRELISTMTDRPDLIMHGLSRYYGLGGLHVLEALGVPIPNTDVSGSLSLGRIIPGIEGATDMEASANDKIAKVVTDAMGPVAAIGFNFWKAMESNDPDQWKRWERALPTSMKNASKAMRFAAREQETNQSGAMIESFDMHNMGYRLDVAAQAMGFTPTRLAQEYEARGAVEDIKVYYMTRRKLLLDSFSFMRVNKDKEGLADVRAAIRDFNTNVPYGPLRITSETLINSLKARYRGIQKFERKIAPSKMMEELYRDSFSNQYPEVYEVQ